MNYRKTAEGVARHLLSRVSRDQREPLAISAIVVEHVVGDVLEAMSRARTAALEEAAGLFAEEAMTDDHVCPDDIAARIRALHSKETP